MRYNKLRFVSFLIYLLNVTMDDFVKKDYHIIDNASIKSKKNLILNVWLFR